jgi:hypothetical protein
MQMILCHFHIVWKQWLLCCGVLLLCCSLFEETVCVGDECNWCQAVTSIVCAAVDMFGMSVAVFSLYVGVNRTRVGMNCSHVLEIGAIIDHLFLWECAPARG